MSSDFKDSVLSFQQKLLSLEEEVEMKCSESNNRRNEIDSIDKNIQTLSNHGNLCNRKSLCARFLVLIFAGIFFIDSLTFPNLLQPFQAQQS